MKRIAQFVVHEARPWIAMSVRVHLGHDRPLLSEERKVSGYFAILQGTDAVARPSSAFF